MKIDKDKKGIIDDFFAETFDEPSSVINREKAMSQEREDSNVGLT